MSNVQFKKITERDNRDIVLFRLSNASGSYVEIINYGATLVSVVVPDSAGIFRDIILNYSRIEDYFSDPFYLGCTVGRFANRIANARFELNGKSYQLNKNDGKNSLHGGFLGFNKKIYEYEITENGVTFSSESQSGESGFPGNLQFSVHYSFSENNELTILYKAVSDERTIFNPTNHAYFNLSATNENILNHELKVFSEKYLEMNDEFLPTGKISNVYQTPMDFRKFEKIAQKTALKKEEKLQGFNTYFIGPDIDPSKQNINHLAALREARSGIAIDVFSSMPGIMIYTGDYLSHPFQPLGGICLEAQFYPDSPNHPDFPSCIIEPGIESSQIIQYRMNGEWRVENELNAFHSPLSINKRESNPVRD